MIVAVPVVLPKVRVVEAPNALIVVAVVLRRSKDDEPVKSEVVKVGDEPNTTTPVPVSSVKVERRVEDKPEYTRFLLLSVRTNLSAVA